MDADDSEFSNDSEEYYDEDSIDEDDEDDLDPDYGAFVRDELFSNDSEEDDEDDDDDDDDDFLDDYQDYDDELYDEDEPYRPSAHQRHRSTYADMDDEYEDFVEENEYWGRYADKFLEYDGHAFANAFNERSNQIPYPNPHYALTAEQLPRTHGPLNLQDQLRALELDPTSFHKVLPEGHAAELHHGGPLSYAAHEAPYSDDDFSDSGSSDGYYEGMIGFDDQEDEDGLEFSNSTDSDSNDIQFTINKDVKFKLTTSDNYSGRDIDIGVTMPTAAAKKTAAPAPTGGSAVAKPTVAASPAPARTTAPVTPPMPKMATPFLAAYEPQPVHPRRRRRRHRPRVEHPAPQQPRSATPQPVASAPAPAPMPAPPAPPAPPTPTVSTPTPTPTPTAAPAQ